ncbi:glycosyltransferase family 4 protein [Salinibacillus aidingensis]|uniref:Glycosyltransferase family 4 protein n=1 Tax=Salinibacillus aidingensis TaxID=237684 RepID=A0ABN1AYI9_9BACI
MPKKRIAFVVNYFYPDLASTGQLMTELCFDLIEDFDITVIAAQPGYAGETVQTKKRYEVEYLENGIKVIRIKLPSVKKTSKWSRIKYITSYFIFALIALIREKNIDIIYTISQPPILGGLIGTIGKFFKRKKHLYNIQDFNPEQAEAVNYTNNKLIYKFAIKLDKLNCKYADQIVLVGNDMVETLKNRFKKGNVPNYTVINNWINENEVTPLPENTDEIEKFKEKYGLRNKFVVMYSGNIGLYYDLENIISVAEQFTQKDIIFLFIGDGAKKKELEEYVNNHRLENVMFLPYQPKDFIKYSLNVGDLHLVVNQKGIKGVSVPSKIYGVMAVGKPILGVIEEGSEAERLITKSRSGVVVEPHKYNEIVEKITYFYKLNKNKRSEIGLRGRRYLETYLTKELSITKYKKILKNL